MNIVFNPSSRASLLCPTFKALKSKTVIEQTQQTSKGCSNEEIYNFIMKIKDCITNAFKKNTNPQKLNIHA